MLGWSCRICSADGTQLFYEAHSRDLELSEACRQVADEVVDCSYLYKDSRASAYWVGCGYPDRYKVRNDKIPYTRLGFPDGTTSLPSFPDDEVFDVELWDQS